MKRIAALLTLLGTVCLPVTGSTHPHVFVTGGAHFEVDDQGRLSKLHVSWIYDSYASLYLLSYLGVDEDGDQVLTEEEKAKILADQTNWPEDFQGDSYLYVSGKKMGLGGPGNPDTRILESGQVEVTFERSLDEPFRPNADGNPVAIVKLYDPTFYYAYEVTDPPRIIGPDGHGCTVEHKPYDANDPTLKALQVELSALGTDETPDQQDVGALFANELRMTCASP